MNEKLYLVIEENPYYESGALGYIDEEYSDGTVLFSKVGSDIEIYLSKYELQEIK